MTPEAFTSGVDGDRGLSFVMVSAGYPPVDRAGLEYGCQRLSAALVRRGHRVTVLTSSRPGLPRRRDEDGVEVLRLLSPIPLGPLWGWTYRWQVRRWLRRLAGWDVVMCHQLYLHSVEANRVATERGRVACHLHVAAQGYSDVSRLRSMRFGRRLLRQALDEASFHLVLSLYSRHDLLVAGADPARVHDYRYFVDTTRFCPGDDQSTAEFLCLGRWHPQKNLPLLLDAFERFAETTPDVRLRLVGGGPEEPALRRKVAGLRCHARVHVQGWADDPVPAYRRAMALVTSSDAEGLSNVTIEALACGTPVITTDVSGAREALGLEDIALHPLQPSQWSRGTGGLLVPRRDAAALALAMAEVARKPDLRLTLSREARARAVSVFSDTASVEAFLATVARYTGVSASARA